MLKNMFLEQAIELLEQVETSVEQKAWCRAYSVYSDNPGQEKLSSDLDDFMRKAYEEGLVITNYYEVIRHWGLNEQDIDGVTPEWLESLPYLCVLACIAWHFRRDHFCEGSLINQSIAEGKLLRLFRRLKQICPTKTLPTTLGHLARVGVEHIPKKSGVYWVLCPTGMPIRFTEQQYNPSASLYPVDKLSQKYESCSEKEILYIGKAAGRKGLRQRLKQYIDYGLNRGINHKGGRAIWQISDAGLLLLAYEECEDAAERERQLLREYQEKNGTYPLANWRG